MSLIRRVDRLAQEHTERAIETITDIMNSNLAEDRDRIRAAEVILDRGHGKPLTATIALPPSKQQAQMLASMTDDELMAAMTRDPLPRLTQEQFDAASDPLLD